MLSQGARPGGTGGVWRVAREWWALALIVAIGAYLRLAHLGALGFRWDEDLSGLAVRAILEKGVPELPSGMIYLRGGLFSHLMAASASVFGFSEFALRLPAALFVHCFRNTPLLVQLFLWYFVVPELLPVAWGDAIKQMNPTTNQVLTVLACLTLYTGAKAAEQVRAGIDSVPASQRQASLALGLDSLGRLAKGLEPGVLHIAGSLPSDVDPSAWVLRSLSVPRRLIVQPAAGAGGPS